MSLIVPAIAAGTALLQTGANLYAQGRMNKKTRQYNEQMYARQRQDSLSDWTMQNEYNSPTAQMARLRAAGLNPNLVYGSGADAQGGTVRSTSADSWRPEAPRLDLSPIGSSLMSYYDIQIKEAQVDNLRAQNTVAMQDALLKAAQTMATTASGQRSQFDLDMASELRATSVEAAKSGLQKLQRESDIMLRADERAAAQNAQSLLKGAEEILGLRLGRARTEDERRNFQQALINMKKDGALKDYEIELNKAGIQKNDPLWARVIAQIVERYVTGEGSINPSKDMPMFRDKSGKKIPRYDSTWYYRK